MKLNGLAEELGKAGASIAFFAMPSSDSITYGAANQSGF
jgi:hypothetical protein